MPQIGLNWEYFLPLLDKALTEKSRAPKSRSVFFEMERLLSATRDACRSSELKMTRVLLAILLGLVSLGNCAGVEPLNWDVLRVANNNRKSFVADDIPQSVRSLEAKPIQIRGYMVISSVFKTQGCKKMDGAKDTRVL